MKKLNSKKAKRITEGVVSDIKLFIGFIAQAVLFAMLTVPLLILIGSNKKIHRIRKNNRDEREDV